MRFDIAQNDATRALDEAAAEVYVFQLPNRKGDGDEDYAAVRPSEELLMTLSEDVYLLQDQPETSIDILNRILLQVFNPDDLREALIETGEYDDADGDGDGELSSEGLNLVRSGSRLKYRHATRRDPLGTYTIAQIAVHMVEKWSGKDTGKPRDFLPPSSTTGTRSKRTTSSARAKTRSSSSAKSGSRGSSTSRTAG